MQKDEFEELLKVGSLNQQQMNKFRKLIETYKDRCATSTTKLTSTNIVKHTIDTGNKGPVVSKAYKTNLEQKKKLKEWIDENLAQGIIEESNSNWASPITVVKKKDGTDRVCGDYRKLNEITVKDEYPLPRIDELIERFEGKKWFSSMDLLSGYHQIEMDENDKKKTAIICHYGLYQYKRMPFGLCNAPRTFQRMMNKIFRPYLDEFITLYLDDILIYSDTFEEHIEHLEKVFEVLKKANLLIKLKKCKFCVDEIEYLGHIVSKNGIQVDPAKIESIKKLKPPTSITGIRSIIGLCSYYRKFVKNFSKIAKPMSNLIKKDIKFEWTKECQEAFETLKEKLITSPILQHPNYEKEFILITDASGTGLGAVLAQLNDQGKEIVVAYASRSLQGAEKRYPITDLECLAIFWGIKYFHKYLLRRKFTIITDHAALKTLKTAKVPSGRRGKWMMELQQYDFEVKHRSGKSNTNADALSRL